MKTSIASPSSHEMKNNYFNPKMTILINRFWKTLALLFILFTGQVDTFAACEISVHGRGDIKAWERLFGTPLRLDVDGWLSRVGGWIDEGIEVGFVKNGEVIELFAGGTNPISGGLKIGELIEENGQYSLKLFADGFIPISDPSLGTISASSILDIPVARPCGDPIIGASIVRTSGDAVGIIEDLSGYASAVIREALTAPNKKLRDALKQAGLVSITEQAHHIIPIELLQKYDVVQDAVEAGFDFNGLINGKGLRSIGNPPIHKGPHKNYTRQIRENIENWAAPLKSNGTYSPKLAKEYLEQVLTPQMKKLFDSNPTTPVNQLIF